jgi:hypothetical protein
MTHPSREHRVERVHRDDIEIGTRPNTAAELIIEQWPKAPKASAERLIQEYGQPHEYTDSQLIWHATKDGWKRTVLSRDEVPHNFPSRHTDFLEQFIDYKVPVDKFNDLARFDGSVMAERTKGELSARCGGTSMNFVALNLAHDIVAGKRSVDEARAEYTNLYLAYKRGEHPPYTLGFQFELPKEDTKDLDTPTISA